MVYSTHLYDLLKVPPDATLGAIARAYKQVARTCHPDKTNHNAELTEMFKDATRAYEILKDFKQREIYDAYGEAGLDGTAAQSENQSQNQAQSFTSQFSFPAGFQSAAFNAPCPASNLFSQLFNDMSSVFGGSAPFDPPFQPAFGPPSADHNKRHVQPAPPDNSKPVRGEDIHHTFKVTLADMYHGKVVKFQLPKVAKCTICDGVGCFNPRTCRVCAGSGRVMVTMVTPFSRFEEFSPCRLCHGTGTFSVPKDKCSACDNGYAVQKTIIKVNVMPGSKDGDKYILRGQSDEGKNTIPGDVIIHLEELPHSFLVRRFNDLYMEHDIDLKTALVGGSFTIHDFLGDDLKILVNTHGKQSLNDAVDSSIQKGEIIGTVSLGDPKTVKDLGMPINDLLANGEYEQNETAGAVPTMARGNLYIRFNVKIPSVEEFATEDLIKLAALLPGRSTETSSETLQVHHLLNLPASGSTDASNIKCPAREKRRQQEEGSSDYDYDNIDISSDEREEVEDEAFYMDEWAKEHGKKRKNNTGGAAPQRVPC